MNQVISVLNNVVDTVVDTFEKEKLYNSVDNDWVIT